QYLDNPEGRAVGFNAWSGEVLAGHYVTIPLRARVHGREERGLLSLNTATHADHRGKGLFTKLAQATYERAASEGYGFVVGVANANSTHGFTKKLGFQLVGPLRAMVGVGAIPFQARMVEPDFEPVRDRERLTWRLAHPVYRYTLARQGRAGLVLSERRMKGFRFLLFSAPESLEGLGLPPEKAPVRKAWIGSGPGYGWGGSAYLNVPMKRRPSPLNLIFKDLTGAGRQLDPARTCFQAIDFDTL
ncbi:MAG: GNAT family N-acetyltransferase, partial [Planctomycetes bacterium]|nr:GNAT family N-acetyltransferase [Planctomycetota bacterium]